MRQIHVSHWCKLAAVRVAGDQSHTGMDLSFGNGMCVQSKVINNFLTRSLLSWFGGGELEHFRWRRVPTAIKKGTVSVTKLY